MGIRAGDILGKSSLSGGFYLSTLCAYCIILMSAQLPNSSFLVKRET